MFQNMKNNFPKMFFYKLFDFTKPLSFITTTVKLHLTIYNVFIFYLRKTFLIPTSIWNWTFSIVDKLTLQTICFYKRMTHSYGLVCLEDISPVMVFTRHLSRIRIGTIFSIQHLCIPVCFQVNILTGFFFNKQYFFSSSFDLLAA